MPSEIKQTISNLIKVNWDFFAEREACWQILGYEFGIDTGDSKSVGCSQPRWCVHESKVITTQIETLLHNSYIRDYKAPYGALIVLTGKSHQKTIVNIKDLVWRMCIPTEHSTPLHDLVSFKLAEVVMLWMI